MSTKLTETEAKRAEQYALIAVLYMILAVVVANILMQMYASRTVQYASAWEILKSTVILLDVIPRLIVAKVFGLDLQAVGNPGIWEHLFSGIIWIAKPAFHMLHQATKR